MVVTYPVVREIRNVSSKKITANEREIISKFFSVGKNINKKMKELNTLILREEI